MWEIPNLKAWAQMLGRTRAFLDQRGYLEVTTPALVPAGAFESAIDPLRVGARELHTSPEIQMKQLLAQHAHSLYQICQVYRDDPPTPHHTQEFTMLEFYRVDASYLDIQTETRELFDRLSGRALPWEVVSVSEKIHEFTGVDLASLPQARGLRAALRAVHMHVDDDDTWEELFFKLMIEKVEPHLPPERPVMLVDYPRSVSPLSQPSSAHPLFAERFEIYWQGMEICNGSGEGTDLHALRKRYEEESLERRRQGKAPHPRPEVLFDALKAGLPAVSGVAVGMNRLFRCLAP